MRPFRKPLDPLVSYLARPVWDFAIGKRERPGRRAALPSGFRVIAHRAGTGYAPENSLAAVRAAVALGVRDIEIDVRQTRDRRWVCFHDPDLNRLAKVNRRVADLTVAELGRCRARRPWTPPPLLSEMLAAVPDGVRLHVDVKGCAEPLPRAAASLLDAVYASGAARRVAITSLLHPVLERVRALDSRVSLGYLTVWLKLDGALRRCLKRHRRSHEPRQAIENAVRLGAEAISPVALQPGLPAFAEAAHRAGLAVTVYTIDSVAAAARAASWGADGVFTNRPERFLLSPSA